MDRLPVSNPDRAAQGRFKGDIDRNAGFRQQAFDHNLARNVMVARLLGYVTLLRQSGVSLAGVVDCVAAVRQNFSSSQGRMHMGFPSAPEQAAHFLPGQLRIGGREVWHLAKNLETRDEIEGLFAEVEHLPVAFNQADTAAEAKGEPGGLCAALVHATTTLIGRPMPVPVQAGRIPLELLRAAYDDWHRDAVVALTNAAAAKSSKPGIPPLVGDRFEGYTPESIVARHEASAKQWNRDASLGVLQYYLQDQPQRTWQWITGKCQFALREVEENFKG